MQLSINLDKYQSINEVLLTKESSGPPKPKPGGGGCGRRRRGSKTVGSSSENVSGWRTAVKYKAH